MPGDCFITKSISMERVPEMVSILVLQHQIPKFRIKPGKFLKETSLTPLYVANSDPDSTNMKTATSL